MKSHGSKWEILIKNSILKISLSQSDLNDNYVNQCFHATELIRTDLSLFNCSNTYSVCTKQRSCDLNPFLLDPFPISQPNKKSDSKTDWYFNVQSPGKNELCITHLSKIWLFSASSLTTPSISSFNFFILYIKVKKQNSAQKSIYFRIFSKLN